MLLEKTEARYLLESMELHYKRNSTIFYPQFGIPGWPENLSDPLLTDALCDQIAQDAYTVVMAEMSRAQEERSAWHLTITIFMMH